MKKYLFISLLLFSIQGRAQFSDLMGAMAVQGAITSASTTSTARGIYAIRKTKLLEIIREAAMEIRTQFYGNYDGVGPENISEGLFGELEWYIGQEGYDSFFIQLNDIDKQSCQFLFTSQTTATSIEVDGYSKDPTCSDSNNMKFIFR